MIKERKDAKTTIVAGILLAGLFAGMLVAYKSELETTSWDAKSQSEKIQQIQQKKIQHFPWKRRK